MTGNVKQTSVLPGIQKEGFAHVARWMFLDQDGEASIFRSFNELGARNILYLQCELLVLEKRLRELDQADVMTDDMDSKDAARTWEILTEQYASGLNPKVQERMQTILELRSKMKEYRMLYTNTAARYISAAKDGKPILIPEEALLLQAEVAKLQQPNKRALGAFKHWFLKPQPVVGGVAKTALDNPNDLVSLGKVPETDYLSVLLRKYWPVKEEISRDGLYRVGRFNETSITTAVAIISILVASFLLIGSIVGLYFAKSNAVKLALVAAFTAAFALSVGLMTKLCRRPSCLRQWGYI
ncbi:hypothetical protein BJY04DRAFT_221598 [Aspergillus karnatakaensis]|uniref:uncharacterized protein n=1 Tax=Aspergillus karnatakaensis TaxID=1810916 RepID=UPI003CCCE015